ncbi:unnamed protein product [Protopolystoma xenopodis]|uniref:Uncharacterized protein n=1 Tax=Protopolystoma xenopodis TaxID=117903 RepID=A0A448WJG4_9PLAT|nr:unnamed protein product [Protopolystoma xenopodis]
MAADGSGWQQTAQAGSGRRVSWENSALNLRDDGAIRPAMRREEGFFSRNECARVRDRCVPACRPTMTAQQGPNEHGLTGPRCERLIGRCIKLTQSNPG